MDSESESRRLLRIHSPTLPQHIPTTMASARTGAFLKPLLAWPAYRITQIPPASVPIKQYCRGQTLRAFTTARCQRDEQRQTAKRTSSISEDISSLVDGTLDPAKGTSSTPASRTSQFKPLDPTQSSGMQGVANELEQAQASRRNSVDELLLRMANPNERRRTISGYKASDINDMFSGNGGQPVLTKEAEPVRLPPNVGRLVAVDEKRGIDVARAFHMMEAQCSRNRVRRSFALQRFYERPGLKRKRLKHERWIKRFKENFKGTVQMVQKMKKQGW